MDKGKTWEKILGFQVGMYVKFRLKGVTNKTWHFGRIIEIVPYKLVLDKPECEYIVLEERTGIRWPLHNEDEMFHAFKKEYIQKSIYDFAI